MGNVVIVNLPSFQAPHQCGVHKTLQTQRKVSSFAGCLKKCTTKQSVNLVFTQCLKLLVWGGGGGGVMWSFSKLKVFHLLDLN